MKKVILLAGLFQFVAAVSSASCDKAYEALSNRINSNHAGIATGTLTGAGSAALAGMSIEMAGVAATAPVLAAGISTTAGTAMTIADINEIEKNNYRLVLAVLAEADAGSGIYLNELSRKIGAHPRVVAQKIREMNFQNELCTNGVLNYDQLVQAVSQSLQSGK